MYRLYFDRTEVEGIGALLSSFGPRAFASPFRSTVPLVSLVKDDWPLLSSVAERIGMRPEGIHFEFQVAPPGVEGNPSQTDVMLLSDRFAMAVEAKWTEARYETVAARLASRIARLCERDNSRSAAQHYESQAAIIAAWLRLVGAAADVSLGVTEVQGVVYQMLHRAASACALSRPGALVYLHFEPSPSNGAATAVQCASDLQELHSILGNPASFPFYVVEIPLRPTAAFRMLETLPKGIAETDRRVREAIALTRLFEFGDPNLRRIGDASGAAKEAATAAASE